jgi:hypothetical protein
MDNAFLCFGWYLRKSLDILADTFRIYWNINTSPLLIEYIEGYQSAWRINNKNKVTYFNNNKTGFFMFFWPCIVV